MKIISCCNISDLENIVDMDSACVPPRPAPPEHYPSEVTPPKPPPPLPYTSTLPPPCPSPSPRRSKTLPQRKFKINTFRHDQVKQFVKLWERVSSAAMINETTVQRSAHVRGGGLCQPLHKQGHHKQHKQPARYLGELIIKFSFTINFLCRSIPNLLNGV